MVHQQDKGQVALTLVLIMTVISALAVSLATRSTVETRIQQTESESVQALLYAQTGLEEAIINSNVTTGTITDNQTYSADITSTGANSISKSRIDAGGTLEINLTGTDYTNLTGYRVDWGPDTGNPQGRPALFTSVIRNTGSISDYAFDYSADNGFVVASAGSDGYALTTNNIPLSSGVVSLRITVLRSSAKLRIVPIGTSAVFPPQIKQVKSVGTVSSAQGANSSVKYGLQYDESLSDTVPSVFEYALFSNGSLIQ